MQRIVRTRSIRNVDTERLICDLARIHDMLHTAEGIREWDAPRGNLIDYGIKAKRIAAEIRRRGNSTEGWCALCTDPLDEDRLPTKYKRGSTAERGGLT